MKPNAYQIAAAVAVYFRLSPQGLAHDPGQPSEMIADEARAVAVYLIRRRTSLRRDQIARLFGIEAHCRHVVIDGMEVDVRRRLGCDQFLKNTVLQIEGFLDTEHDVASAAAGMAAAERARAPVSRVREFA